MRRKLLAVYRRLFAAFGPQGWWPGETPFEVAVGAILTQNTNWGNVAKAIRNLKDSGALTAEAIHSLSAHELAALIRPAGYYNIKARRLRNFVDLLMEEYGGSMDRMEEEELRVIRERLLAVNGIGQETADSIILYGLGKPVFVVDAYTKRVLSRHNILLDHAVPYEKVQELFHDTLDREASLFNEYHALLVRLGKDFCRPKPRCEGCPLGGL